jgi:hypothetical protein
MSTSKSFNTKKRRKDNTKAAAAPKSASTDDDDATKTTTVPRPKNKNKNKKATTSLTFQEKIATAHAEKNAKRQKQMFLDVVLSKEFGTYKERGVSFVREMTAEMLPSFLILSNDRCCDDIMSAR